MSFFKKPSSKPSSSAKRKVSNEDSTERMKRIKRNKQQDDVVTSDESDGEIDASFKSKSMREYSSSESEDETADQKRKRLAQEHLDQLREYASSDEEIDDDGNHVARKLREENLARRGRLQKNIAAMYIKPTPEDVTMCRGHSLPITCIALTPDNKFAFTGSKDCSIIKWSIESGKKVHQIPCGKKSKTGHLTHILCLCVSSDCHYLASGDSSSIIIIWNPVTCELLKSTSSHKHRAAVSGLAFRHGTHELYSSSFDRTVKVWNVCDAGVVYVETLFGHQDIITAIDALPSGRAITSGAKDGSLRIWKIAEESQLVFHGHGGSIDCVCFINDNHFLSGADDNSVALWSTLKKKPIATVKNAHPGDSINGTMVASDNWITSVAAVRNTDLVASGSKDGYIRFWKCGEGFRTLTPLFSLPMLGTVNSLQFSADGQLLVAGIGREHKLGRWWNIKQAANSLAIIRLSKLSKKAESSVDDNI